MSVTEGDISRLNVQKNPNISVKKIEIVLAVAGNTLGKRTVCGCVCMCGCTDVNMNVCVCVCTDVNMIVKVMGKHQQANLKQMVCVCACAHCSVCACVSNVCVCQIIASTR